MSYRTGSKNIVVNTWSDAAREAAAASRQAAMKGTEEADSKSRGQLSSQQHKAAAEAHAKAEELHRKAVGVSIGKAQQQHKQAYFHHMNQASGHQAIASRFGNK